MVESGFVGFVLRTLVSNHIDACLRDMSSYKGRVVDALALRGDEGRGQLRKAPGSR